MSENAVLQFYSAVQTRPETGYQTGLKWKVATHPSIQTIFVFISVLVMSTFTRTSPSETFAVIVQGSSLQAGSVSSVSLPVEIIICQIAPVAKINIKVASPWCLEPWKFVRTISIAQETRAQISNTPSRNLVRSTLSMPCRQRKQTIKIRCAYFIRKYAQICFPLSEFLLSTLLQITYRSLARLIRRSSHH